MVSKKVIITAFILFVIVTAGIMIGWSAGRAELYDYDYSNIGDLNDGLLFDYMIPTKVPFEEMKITDSKIENSGQQLVIELMNKNKEFIDIRISTNPVQYDENIKIEKVSIGNNAQGFFIPNDEGKRILSWQNDGFYYEITYFFKLTPSEVSKKQLIKMAESFK
ncbi:DUF4367 domain-containing protein [Bacillus marasmi]|uniref:DUF4367 domain-containing protein n=1 Tax=Bacillus marasmi TaxID=1926279 RepID=UPI0011C7CAE4|nr:DUF4367 domain-containing protein [Bacillus marasmi]